MASLPGSARGPVGDPVAGSVDDGALIMTPYHFCHNRMERLGDYKEVHFHVSLRGKWNDSCHPDTTWQHRCLNCLFLRNDCQCKCVAIGSNGSL